MKNATICILLLSVTICLAGWERTYGGSHYDHGESVAQTSDGGYIVSGETCSFGAGNNDVYLVKIDAEGDTIWTRTYGGDENEYGKSVAQTSDGGYIVAGYTYSFGAGEFDVYLIKTDSEGDTIWTRTYGGSNWDWGESVAQTSDGGYIIAGGTKSFGAGERDVYLVKTDALGDTLWTRTYGGSDEDYGYSIALTTDGGFIIAGYTESFGAGRSDVYLIKTDGGGDTIWTRTYGGIYSDLGYSVALTSDGGHIIAGMTKSFGADSADIYLIKTDTSGDTIWTRTYGGSESDYGWSIAQTTDGGYIVAGWTKSFGAGEHDVYLVKTDSDGDTLWTRTYGGSESDVVYSVAQTTYGGYIVAGWTHSFGAGGSDFYLIKTNSLGFTAIGESPSARPEEIAINAYPNPFNSTITITLETPSLSPPQAGEMPKAEGVNIEIFDIAGRIVYETPVGAGLRPARGEGGSETAPLRNETVV
ncbi:MAG: PQQ-like beta-propeller repeat protein, partial [Victivallales bacterium]|nr:PQQ-like beta-propeller repeat protein [Victivallales bacterium]